MKCTLKMFSTSRAMIRKTIFNQQVTFLKCLFSSYFKIFSFGVINLWIVTSNKQTLLISLFELSLKICDKRIFYTLCNIHLILLCKNSSEFKYF